MVKCAVINCQNYEGDELLLTKLKYFWFPHDEKLRSVWLKVSGRKSNEQQHMKICSEHFCEQDYRLKDILLNTEWSKRRLKPGAVPSLKLPTQDEISLSTLQEDSNISSTLSLASSGGNISASSGDCSTLGFRDIGVQSSICARNMAVQTGRKLERFLQKENSELKKQLNGEKRKNRAYSSLHQKWNTLNCQISKIFSKGQLRKLRDPHQRRIQWTPDDISRAISLHAAGAKAYRLLLSRGFPLPAIATLKRWAGKLKLTPGILKAVLNLLENSDYCEKERVCVLSFDEMKIKSVFEYHRSCDKVLKPSKYVQVAMIRGLYKNWKQIIYYNFDSAMTATTITDIIRALKIIKFHVVAVVCDMGPTNMGLWRSLGIGYEKPFFTVDDQKVFTFADPPHLMKLIRNHFLDTGYVLEKGGKKHWITSKPVVELLNNQPNELKICHKITLTHLDVKDAARQKVKYAVQLLSNSASQGIRRAVSLGLIKSEDAMTTSDFMKIMNDWFDMFNASSAARGCRERLKAFDHTNGVHQSVIQDSNELISHLRVPNMRTLLPCQKGILVNNAALVALSGWLQITYGNPYILTRRLQQDDLERFFGTIRSKGGLHDHPTALEFTYRLRNSILGRSDASQQVNSSNVEEVDEQFDEQQFTCGLLRDIAHEVNETGYGGMLDCDDQINADFEEENLPPSCSELEEDAIEYIAGYVIKKLKLQVSPPDESTLTWVDQVSEGGLTKPGRNFTNKLMLLEKNFKRLHGETFNVEQKAIESCINLSKNVDLLLNAKMLFFRTRMYIRIKNLNRNIVNATKARKRKIKRIVA